jgi:hypothetical protein
VVLFRHDEMQDLTNGGKPLVSPNDIRKREQEKRAEDHAVMMEKLKKEMKQTEDLTRVKSQEFCDSDLEGVDPQKFTGPIVYNCAFTQVKNYQLLLGHQSDVLSHLVIVAAERKPIPALFVTDNVSKKEYRIPLKCLDIHYHVVYVSCLPNLYILPNFQTLTLRISEIVPKDDTTAESKTKKEECKEDPELSSTSSVTEKLRNATASECSIFTFYRNEIYFSRKVFETLIWPYRRLNRLFMRQFFDPKMAAQDSIYLHLFARGGQHHHTDIEWDPKAATIEFGVCLARFRGLFLSCNDTRAFVALAGVMGRLGCYHIGHFPWGDVRTPEVLWFIQIPKDTDNPKSSDEKEP